MPDATIKRLEEMETFYDGMVTRARAELGITSWGMQVFNFPPGFDQYPNHHHGEGAVDPGQEELYIPLAGSATLHLDGEEHRLEPGVWARVGISQLRRLEPGDGAALPSHRRDAGHAIRAAEVDRARRSASGDAGLVQAEAELLEAAQAGDEQAFRALTEPYARELHSTATECSVRCTTLRTHTRRPCCAHGATCTASSR